MRLTLTLTLNLNLTLTLTLNLTLTLTLTRALTQVNGGSLPAAVARIWRARGPRGFFPGFGLHCFLETVGSTVYLGVYHLAKRLGTSWQLRRRDIGLQPGIHRVAAQDT